MSKVIILGVSSAVATEGHENTHMAIVGSERTVLVDCVGSPLIRLERAGIDFHGVTDLILTHFHPDHVSGVPLLLTDMWLLGRQSALSIHGLAHTLDRVEALMGFYGWSEWPNFFPVSFHQVPDRERSPVLQCKDFNIQGSPMRHFVPTMGIRVEFGGTSRVLAYSGDTEPCAEVARLAAGADILIHEAAGLGKGHSSAEQAGETARQAEAGRLLLIHYPTGKHAEGDLVAQARRRFQGAVELAKDSMVLEIG